jgi:hypothetical protein
MGLAQRHQGPGQPSSQPRLTNSIPGGDRASRGHAPGPTAGSRSRRPDPSIAHRGIMSSSSLGSPRLGIASGRRPARPPMPRNRRLGAPVAARTVHQRPGARARQRRAGGAQNMRCRRRESRSALSHCPRPSPAGVRRYRRRGRRSAMRACRAAVRPVAVEVTTSRLVPPALIADYGTCSPPARVNERDSKHASVCCTRVVGALIATRTLKAGYGVLRQPTQR